MFPVAVALFVAADHYNFRDVYERALMSASGEDNFIGFWAFGAFVVMYALRFFEMNVTFLVAEAKDFWVQALLVAIGGTLELIVKTVQTLSHQSPKFASRVEEFCDSLGEPGCTCDFYVWREQPSWTSRGLLRRTTARSRSGRSSPRASSLRSRTSTAFGQRSLETC